MGINKLVFAALTTGCLVAAGAGGYMAVRLSQPAAPAAPSPTLPADSPLGGAPGTVTESEGLITPLPEPSSPPPATAPPTAESRPAPAPAPAGGGAGETAPRPRDPSQPAHAVARDSSSRTPARSPGRARAGSHPGGPELGVDVGDTTGD
jgi:hypothetical protein